MKTTVIILAALMSLVSVNLSANNVKPEDVNLGVELLSKRSMSKEYIINNEQDSTSTMRIVYTDNNTGNRTAKIVYHLDSESGKWIVSNRTEYKYNNQNQLTQVVNYYWDKVNAEWTNVQVQDILR
ncbi:hypothetical protein [Dysgonomonas sp. 25]|uniref:hypothetical protein n=1 Tax=Dysgonomonas sp. 25 TaxID=2302933 RepID=UPI0013D24E5F|nr:hypothetical protein [Dysgonomonas sp. 25]NDV69776.1 hypothetical protein [Dysgonomonas sp. 25]